MKTVIQRVNHSSVSVEGKVQSKIEGGLMVLVGFAPEDENLDLRVVREKILGMRIFTDERGKFQYSVQDVGGFVLLVPQFTLIADTSRGRRPDFFGAMKPDRAKKRFSELVECFRETFARTEAGVFGAYMQVALENDGPVTILQDF